MFHGHLFLALFSFKPFETRLFFPLKMQIFNEFNARKPDEMNVFSGVTKNYLFMGIVGSTFVLQV